MVNPTFTEVFAKLVLPDNTEYSGSLKLDNNYYKYHNQGKIIFANGDKYEGKWDLGIIDGHGTYEWKSRQKYIGNFCNGQRQGFGKMKTKNQIWEEGLW